MLPYSLELGIRIFSLEFVIGYMTKRVSEANEFVISQ